MSHVTRVSLSDAFSKTLDACWRKYVIYRCHAAA